MNRDEKSYGQMVEDSIWEGEMICDECETVAHCLKNGCVPKTTKQTEAMKLALEALEMYMTMDSVDEAHLLEVDIAPKAITALRQAIEQAELENRPGLALKLAMAEANDKRLDALKAEQAQPVAWMVKAHGVVQRLSVRADVADEYACQWRNSDPDADLYPLYAAPPRQPWVGLTDEEREAIADEYQSSAAAALMSEAKLKEKNT